MCHAQDPAWQGLYWPPKGVILETPEQIARHARGVYLHSAVSHAMPPGNRTWMEQEERDRIATWFQSVR